MLCLEALQTQFKEFFASKGVNSSDHLNQCWQQDFEEYTLCEPETYRRDLLRNLDRLEWAIFRAVIAYGVLRMKENESRCSDARREKLKWKAVGLCQTSGSKHGTMSDEQDTSSRSRNDADTEDAVIRPVNDQVPLVESFLTGKTQEAQVQELTCLKKRITKLERKKKARTRGLKRLYKVGLSARIDSSDDEARGVANLKRNSNAKAVNNCCATTTTTDVTRPKAKGLVIQEQEQVSTPITSLKDKGKGIMVEEHLKMKKKDQVLFDE
ncbi:hypothetical protein Tco_0214186 [Tanacetum coccineum]